MVSKSKHGAADARQAVKLTQVRPWVHRWHRLKVALTTFFCGISLSQVAPAAPRSFPALALSLSVLSPSVPHRSSANTSLDRLARLMHAFPAGDIAAAGRRCYTLKGTLA